MAMLQSVNAATSLAGSMTSSSGTTNTADTSGSTRHQHDLRTGKLKTKYTNHTKYPVILWLLLKPIYKWRAAKRGMQSESRILKMAFTFGFDIRSRDLRTLLCGYHVVELVTN